MLFTHLFSAGVYALDGHMVGVEVDISGGLPQFAVVGLPDSAVKEATDRVRSALKNLGFTYPARRITVNLAPADIRKTGPVYDLPMLLGLLASSEQISPLPQDIAVIGELSLDGVVRPVQGALPMALACRKAGIKSLYLPLANAGEAAFVQGLCVYGVTSAGQVVAHLAGREALQAVQPEALDLNKVMQVADMADVRGQLEARRALEIAAVGMHNVLLSGTPGTGKSMLAKRLPGILPPLSYDEAVETSKIYSVAGALPREKGVPSFITKRPFRSPHHTVSEVGLSGGGSRPRPGEISMAHNGVLFLDELPEFARTSLEVLRQPMEDAQVTVSRAWGSVTYPCKFMLVAAMNPCPCGYFGHPTRECRCTPLARGRYMQKISGPLVDRMDMHVEVLPVDYTSLSAKKGGESSAEIRVRVMAARDFQMQTGRKDSTNSALVGDALRVACKTSSKAQDLLKTAFEKMGLSARGYDRVLRVARSIADLAQSENVDLPHVAEAIQYRNMDRKYANT